MTYYRAFALRKLSIPRTMHTMPLAAMTALLIYTTSPYANDFGNAIKAQRSLLDTKTQAANAAATVKEAQSRMQDRAIYLFYKVYLSAKGSGLRTSFPEDGIKYDMYVRETQGIGDITIQKRYDFNKFLVVVDEHLDTKEPVFAIEGYGNIAAHSELIDHQLSQKGVSASNCMIQIHVGYTKHKYPCGPYFEGKLDEAVMADMKKAITGAIASKAK